MFTQDGSSLLIADEKQIKSTNLIRSSTIWEGSGRIFGFTQINSTYVVIVDHKQHCLWLLERSLEIFRELAGTCANSGFIDGKSGKFNQPMCAELDKLHTGKILITDRLNHALRSVDIATGEVSTVVNGLYFPDGMSWNGAHLLVINTNYIAEIVWDIHGTATATILAGSRTRGLENGRFIDARFDGLKQITELRPNYFLVTDSGNKAIRLLDINSKKVLPVCVKNPCNIQSDYSFSEEVFGILKSANGVFVGSVGHIYTLSGEKRNHC